MLALIRNETLKLLRRRRFVIVISILTAILLIVAYSQYRILRDSEKRNWRADLQERIARAENVLRRGRANASWQRSIRADIGRMQFYLDHDIDPQKPNVPRFVRTFPNVAGSLLLLPLLVAILGSDIVSAENAEGTDKLLLTRPVKRWKILLAKLLTLWMFATLTLLCGAIIAFVTSSVALPSHGWTEPSFSGFQLSNATVKLDAVREQPLWRDALIAYGLEWYSMIAFASIALLMSVIFRSSAASIGTMLASLIGGTILTHISPDWTAGKYLFVGALPLADYYTGEPPPYDGMSLMFCIALLAVWAIGTVTIAFTLFTRRDVFG